MSNRSLAFLFAALLAFAGAGHAQEILEPVILVAKPEFRDNLYGSSVVVVTPLGDDQHVGFIVNRPTSVRLGMDPVYVGGPSGSQHLFAMVQRPESPGEHSLAVMPGLYIAFESGVVEKIIESNLKQTRLLAGLVAWRPGELRAEIEAGAWYVLAPDPALAMRKPEGLWEELVHRSQQADNTI